MPGWKLWTRFALAFFIFLSACSANILDASAQKSTDEALFEDAVKLTDEQNYSAALVKFSQLSSSYNTRSDVLEAWAGAYAGDCGLDFAGYMAAVGAMNFGTSSFFAALMGAWNNVTVNPASCTSAEAKIKLIWTTQAATASQQLFMVVLSMAKMGVYIRSKADVDGTGLGDGTVDGTFNACTNSAANLTDAEIKEITTGFSLFLLNVAGFITSLSPTMSGATAAINAACALATVNPCSTTDTANVTAGMVDAMRDLLNTLNTGGGIGLGACVDPALNPCCP